MSRIQKSEGKLLRLLQKASEQLELWSESQGRAVAQLSSIANLSEQLEALERCEKGGSLGVVGRYPLAPALLRGKIVESMERALERASKERKVLSEVVQRLRRFAREGQSAFEELVGDYVQWLTDIHTAYGCDLDGKSSAWRAIRYTTEVMRGVCETWERAPDGVQETLTHVNYTLSRGKS